MQKVVRKVLRAVAGYDPTYYDMHDDPNEACFARLYLEPIIRHAEAQGIHPPAAVLDAGCQTGRLTVPLAAQGYQVTGIDTSGFALRRAHAHVRAAGASATFLHGEIREVLAREPGRSYDIVICAEVLYLVPAYREMLRALAGAVRPGGLLCVSHRTAFYYLLEALRHRDWATAHRVLDAREGHFEGPFPERGDYNWQSESDLRALYAALGFTDPALYPIDRFAWLAGLSPSVLSEEDRVKWLELERRGSEPPPGCSRYVLAIATKPREGAA